MSRLYYGLLVEDSSLHDDDLYEITKPGDRKPKSASRLYDYEDDLFYDDDGRET